MIGNVILAVKKKIPSTFWIKSRFVKNAGKDKDKQWIFSLA